MEIFRAGEILSDLARPDGLPVSLDQASLSLAREEQIGDAGCRQRIGQTCHHHE
jgi:hypothetical protein